MKKSLLFLSILFLCFVALSQETKTTIDKKKLRRVITLEAGLYASQLGIVYHFWYRDVDRVPFHFYNDSKGYLQIDKFGHAFTAYIESDFAYQALRNTGVSKKHALLYGGSLGFLMQAPIEIFDGLYEGWGFSKSDFLANTIGSALVIGQHLAWDEIRIKMKFSFHTSRYAAKFPSILGANKIESLLYDYNGHHYWLSANLHSFRLPVHKSINLAVGYSANGMIGEFSNTEKQHEIFGGKIERYRQFFISPDLDLTKIKVNKKWQKTILKILNIYKLPMPVLEINKIDKIKLRFF